MFILCAINSFFFFLSFPPACFSVISHIKSMVILRANYVKIHTHHFNDGICQPLSGNWLIKTSNIPFSVLTFNYRIVLTPLLRDPKSSNFHSMIVSGRGFVLLMYIVKRCHCKVNMCLAPCSIISF